MTDTTKRTAGAFDVRNIIGALLTVYGVILLLMGLFGKTSPEKTGDFNANLWTGVGLLLVGLGFVAWWRIRPLAVPDDIDKDEVEPPQARTQ